MLLLPALVALDLPGAVAGARFPGTREVPALSSVLSLLALKAIGRRRVSHVDDVCSDPALASFAGLESLPKASCLGSYSYRLTALPRRGAAGRPGTLDDQDRPDPGRRLRPGLPRDHALRRRRRAGDPLRPAALAAHRSGAVVLRPRRADTQPRLRQRRLHQGRPSRPGDRVRAPLAGRDRQRARAAGLRLQGHHRRRPGRTARRRADVHHAARAQRQADRRSWKRCPTAPGRRSPSSAAAPTPSPKSTSRTSPSAAAPPRCARSPSAASATNTRP